MAGAELSVDRPTECIRSEVLNGTVSRGVNVGVGNQLVGAVVALGAAQASIRAGADAKVIARLETDNTGNLPVAGDNLHRFSRKLRGCVNGREIHDLSTIAA